MRLVHCDDDSTEAARTAVGQREARQQVKVNHSSFVRPLSACLVALLQAGHKTRQWKERKNKVWSLSCLQKARGLNEK